jgi:membrane protein required for colicin V production
MYWLDIVLLIFLALSTFNGFIQGLIKAALSLVGIIIGVLLAGNLYQPLSGLLGFIPNEDIADIVAFLLILVGVMIIANLLARLLKTVATIVMLSWVNRLGGAIFGMLVGAIFLSAILVTWAKFSGSDTITESVIASFFLDKFPLILALLPADFDVIRDFFQ